MDTWDLIDAERHDLADLADTLTPAQWDTTSLCTAWRVRDVVAHVTEGATLSMWSAMLTLLKYGFRIGPMLEREAIKCGAAPTDELARELRATIGKRTTPPGVKPPGVLSDEVIHHQDIRRPLGLAREIPADRLRVVLDEVKTVGNSLLPGKKRVAGLHLRATDLDWETGGASGAEVNGPGEAILMAVAGRPVALADLSGAGVEQLRARIGG